MLYSGKLLGIHHVRLADSTTIIPVNGTLLHNLPVSLSITVVADWMLQGTLAPSQYPKRRLFVRSRKVAKPRDWYFKLSYRFEIWQAHRQHCCRSACQISERSDNFKYKSRGFETLRDLTERRLFEYWAGAQFIDIHEFCILVLDLPKNKWMA